MELRPCPFDIGNGDLALLAILDGADHGGVADGVDIALALLAHLVLVHAAGNIDRQYQHQIDRRPGGAHRGGQTQQDGQDQKKRGQKKREKQAHGQPLSEWHCPW